MFGTGGRASHETQEYLRDTIAQWRQDLETRAPGMSDAFAGDAQIYVVQVNLRDAPNETERRSLLQVPTAFSISSDEVSAPIAAGGNVLRQSSDFQALMKSLRGVARSAPDAR